MCTDEVSRASLHRQTPVPCPNMSLSGSKFLGKEKCLHTAHPETGVCEAWGTHMKLPIHVSKSLPPTDSNAWETWCPGVSLVLDVAVCVTMCVHVGLSTIKEKQTGWLLWGLEETAGWCCVCSPIENGWSRAADHGAR